MSGADQGHTQATAGRSSSPTKRAPTLSDIASKLKISASSTGADGAGADAHAPAISNAIAGSTQEVSSRGRLGLAGRLAGGDTSVDTAADESGATDGAAPRSPTKRTESAVPSLEEIRERLSRKGLQHSKSSANVKVDAPKAPAESIGATPAASATPTASASAPAPAPAPAAQPPPAEPAKAVPAAPAKAPGPPPVKPAGAAAKTPVVGADGKKVHPLQHKWTLYFDSQSFNPSQAAGSSSQTSTPTGTPQMGGAAAGSGAVPYPTALSPSQGAHVPPSPAPAGPPVTAPATWEAALRMLGAYNDVESFFATFSTLRRPSQLEKSSNYHLFKDGIKPMWEDRRNANGGKWTLTLKATNNPALLDRSWMWLVLALIGEELDPHDMITGAVCSVRAKGDRLSIWTRSKDDVTKLNELARRFVSILDLEKEPGVGLEFAYNTGQSLPQPNGFWSFYNPPTAAAGTPGGRQHALGGFGAGSPAQGKAAFSPPHGSARNAFAGPPGGAGASVLRRGQSSENPFAPGTSGGILNRASTTVDGPRPVLGSSSPVKRGGPLP